MNIDRELFDEENSYIQILDKWENFGTQNGIADGCQQRTVEELADSNHSTVKAMQIYLKGILQRIREHDETLDLWKYLFRA